MQQPEQNTQSPTTNATQQVPTLATIEAAAKRIAPHAHVTPVLTSRQINTISGANIWFKCENFQRIGAFKMRGATNAALSLSPQELGMGLATHSSGNHAQAVAVAAQITNTRAWIVMPETAPAVKKSAVEGYGAQVISCKPTLEARETTLAQVIQRTGAHFIHPYDDYRVIAGQATAAFELLQQVQQPLDMVMAPVGGGGLLAGTALATHYLAPNTQVLAAEPTGADDAYRSLQKGSIVPSVNPNTIADGLLTSVGSRNFPIIQKHVQEIITVSDPEIIKAMRLIWERMKIIIEPSCAVPLAAVLQQPQKFYQKNIGIILTGGNVDLNKLPF